MLSTFPSKPWLLRSALVAFVATLLALVALAVQADPLPVDPWLKLGIASSRVFYALAIGLSAFVVAVLITGQAREPRRKAEFA